jgi:hypothetical protein
LSGSGGAIFGFRKRRLTRHKIVVPAHRPIKRSTLSYIIKQAKLTVEEFNELL